MRESGILLPITSLPSEYGIGSFSKEAYEFIDILKRSGQKKWQILPLGPTGYGDSPYQSFSTFAGNPYFIDLNALIEEGLLTKKECDHYDWGENPKYVDYEKIYNSRFLVLRKAFERFHAEKNQEYQEFVKNNSFWLEDYAAYTAIKSSQDGKSWKEWEGKLSDRNSKKTKKYEQKLEEEIRFVYFQQYLFAKQWKKLKAYANKKGIQIIGDIPIYVAFDSADTWANPELFQFDEENNPKAVAGCPPDAFSSTGQLWGNPLYDWEYHKKTGYEWWIKRIKHCFELYDVVRVDHFRGFDEYYAIPYGDKTAEFGQWEQGPGIELFQKIKKELGEVNIIAEDLGYLTESVIKLVHDTGYPGMKILQFAFDSREESDYLPHNYDKNCVVYTGTHDNETTTAWYQVIPEHDRKFSIEYINNKKTKKEEIAWDFIRLAMASVADLCVIPMQDYLCLGAEARMNTPSTLGDNWKWRLEKGQITKELEKKMRRMSELYSRTKKKVKKEKKAKKEKNKGKK